jgi:hypothetical protein
VPFWVVPAESMSPPGGEGSEQPGGYL